MANDLISNRIQDTKEEIGTERGTGKDKLVNVKVYEETESEETLISSLSPPTRDLDWKDLSLSSDEMKALTAYEDDESTKPPDGISSHPTISASLASAAEADETDDRVSFTGGWCKETGKSTSDQHLTDLKLAGGLAELLQGNALFQI